jgi:hypothetical protein
MRLMLMSVVLSGITLVTAVSTGVWRPRIEFASSCSPAMVTLLSASCGDGLRPLTTSTIAVDVASPPEVAAVTMSTPEASPIRSAVEAAPAREGRPQKHAATQFRAKASRHANAPAAVEALAVAGRSR